MKENKKEHNRIEWKEQRRKADNRIGDEGARMISEVLKSNSTLTKLNLYSEGEYKEWKKIKRA